MSSPEEWFKGLPVITKYYFVVAVTSTVLASFQIVNPMWFVLDFDLVWHKFQIWRLVTCFLYFGNFGMPWLFQMYILVKYFDLLERTYYSHGPRGTAEMTFLVAFVGSLMLAIAYYWGNMLILGPALVFSVLYIWSRQDPYRAVTMWGFQFKAWHFPFVLLLISVLMGNSPTLNILGIVVGHAWHFLVDVLPVTHNVTLIRTPQFVYDAYEARQVGARSRQWNAGAGHRLN